MSVRRGRTPGENLQTAGASVSSPPLEYHQTPHLKGRGQIGGVKLGLQIETLGTGFKILVRTELDFITAAHKTQLFLLGRESAMNEAFRGTNTPFSTSTPNCQKTDPLELHLNV